MKNNKAIRYIGLLVLGVLLGWILFGGSSEDDSGHDHNEVAEANAMWTCSMHPQIMQPEPGDCPICGMDLIPAEAGSDGLLADQFRLTENAMALANIQTTVVGAGNFEGNEIKLSGKIAENEEANAVQVSYFSGRIERLNVSFTGEEVRQGQLLATIYSPELYAAQQELITAASLKESQPALYKAVRNKLKLWKLSESQINQIEATGKVKENFPVYATVSGTVTEKLVEQGDYVKQGEPMLKIANLSTVWANFDVYENQIDLFKKGQEVTVTTNAYPNKEFKGKIDFIDPVLDTQTRTLTLRVVLNNKDDIFKPGMFVSAKIDGVIPKSDETLTIPASAVLWTGERSIVYLKTDPLQPVFEMREVKLGKQLGNEYQVEEGLFAGNEIVTNGTFTVDAAAQLQGKKSMMNKEGAATVTGHEGHSGMQTNASMPGSDQITINERLPVSDKFKGQLKAVLDDYINLKDALVIENTKNTTAAAKRFLDDLNKVDIKLLKDEKTHNLWMALDSELKEGAKAISNASDVKTQRLHFKDFSSHLIKAVQLFGVNEKVYVEYCPMADNNKGAYWLRKEEKVINPYFGDAMLTCGEVIQIIE